MLRKTAGVGSSPYQPMPNPSPFVSSAPSCECRLWTISECSGSYNSCRSTSGDPEYAIQRHISSWLRLRCLRRAPAPTLPAPASARSLGLAQSRAAVHGQPVDDEHVDREHRERPERIRRQEHQLSDAVEAGNGDPEPPCPVAAADDGRAGRQLRDPEDHDDPAPGLEVAEDEVRAADVHVGGNDRQDPVDEVPYTCDEEEDRGEHNPTGPLRLRDGCCVTRPCCRAAHVSVLLIGR